MNEITLELPLPPSIENTASPHPMQRHRQKNAYRKKAWAAAVEQHKPPRDPPPLVVATSRFYVHSERDEDNLAASLKWVWDALKREQTGKLHWRQGLADQCGYFVDDDPAHLQQLSPAQEVDRERPRLLVTLRWDK